MAVSVTLLSLLAFLNFLGMIGSDYDKCLSFNATNASEWMFSRLSTERYPRLVNCKILKKTYFLDIICLGVSLVNLLLGINCTVFAGKVFKSPSFSAYIDSRSQLRVAARELKIVEFPVRVAKAAPLS